MSNIISTVYSLFLKLYLMFSFEFAQIISRRCQNFIAFLNRTGVALLPFVAKR